MNGPDGKPILVKLPSVLLIDDKAGKPEGINLVIGRRPRPRSATRPEIARCSNGPARGAAPA